MTRRSHRPLRLWVIGGIAAIVVLILGANGHLLYVALSSQPGCAGDTIRADDDGAVQVLRPAKEGC